MTELRKEALAATAPLSVLLVSGPSGGGKSTFIRQWQERALPPEILSRLPIAAPQPVIEANDVLKGDLPSAVYGERIKAGGCLVHYDMVFARRYGIREYADDPALRLLADAPGLTVVFIRPSAACLRQQFHDRQQRLQSAKSAVSRFWRQLVRRPLRRVQAWATGRPVTTTEEWYTRDEELEAAYGRWEQFIHALAATHQGTSVVRVEPAGGAAGEPRFRLCSEPSDVAPASPAPLSRTARLDLDALVRDRLVVVALAGDRVTAGTLRAHGARDVLVLERAGSPVPLRREDHVEWRYTRLADARVNNCAVAILHGPAAFLLIDKKKFGRFSHVLVPAGLPTLAAWLGLLRYGWRGVLTVVGTTVIREGGRSTRYRVLAARANLRDNRRQYGPAGLAPLPLLQRLQGLNYVVLRWSEKIEAGEHEGDIDLLVDHEALAGLRERFGQQVGTYPLDVYTDDGQGGFCYKSVPYFTAPLAAGLLGSGTLTPNGIRVAAPSWRFLAFCYHLTFHNKSEKVRPGTTVIAADTFQSPHYYHELVRLAALAGESVPRSYDDLEQRLRQAGVMPSLDLIGFYSNGNEFLKKRYFEQAAAKVGLATFFVRDFGSGLEVVPELRARLRETFEILVEGPVDDANRARVLKGVRGGNWADPAAPGGRAEPVYWFVCWDHAPRLPSARTRRKHPRVDNENIRLKDELRRELSNTPKALRVIHSSDNAMEALDHLRHLGLTDHPAIAARLAAGK
jgi:hypothetical protein